MLVDANGPAKVTRVYSDHADGQWGVGEQISVFVEFTSAIEVMGAPSLILRTGCSASTPCHTREIQRLRCQATAGKFSVSFGGQKVFNIPYNANQRMLGDYLTRMTQLDRVKVVYSIDEDAACTFFGNNITITFESVNIEGIDGDLPELTADKDNVGGDGVNLFHIRFSPTLTSLAWEIQKGNKVPDRVANYVGQSNPKTLQFTYTIRPGDNATRLAYVNSDSLALSLMGTTGARIYNANSNRKVAVNAKLPPPGFAGNWETGVGSSLSATSNLMIDVSRPVVVSVTSPHTDGTFGIGEAILIHVLFSLPIVVTGSPTLVLETGLVDRIIPFVQVLNTPDGNVAQFMYVVQSKDTSPDLAYAGTSVLELNGGAIKRKSTTPTTDAILTLPVNGERGSLSVNKNIVIDTTNPEVVSVTSVTTNGVYTAGDTVDLLVTFKAPVVVSGTPSLLLSTGKVDLYPGSFVQAAPLSTTTSPRTILFPAVDHGLSTLESKGLQFVIDGKLLTVDSVQGDAVTMLEVYTGTRVDPMVVAAGGAGGTISIKTPGFRSALYISGSGTAQLVFRYKVQRGDVSLDLDYTTTSALTLGTGGSIKRLSTNPVTDADLTLAIPGAVNSLSFSSALVINTDAPRILQTNAITRDGVYRAGDIITLALVFDLPVIVVSTASLLMSVTAPERYALYTGKGSGTTTLEFTFTCGPNDQTIVFDFVDTKALRAAVGSIFGDIRRKAMAPMLPAVLDLPAAGLSSKGIAINQGCVFVTGVTSTHEDATLGAGEVVDVLVAFSASVDVNIPNGGTLTLVLTTTNAAVYVSGSGSNVLTFRYVVKVDDMATRLNYDGIYALKLTGGVTIRASVGSQLASTVLPPPATGSNLVLKSTLFIDTSPPKVLLVSTKALDGVYTVGDQLIVAVKFNAAIDVAPAALGAGRPMLLLSAGVDNGVATQLAASEDDTLYFSYAVTAGHSIASLGYYSRVALKCVGAAGVNQDPTQDALLATAAALSTRVFVAWSELSAASVPLKSQVRVKSFDAQQFPPRWVIEDGGVSPTSNIQFDGTQVATAPMLHTFTSKVYLTWQETSAMTANNPTQIRVAVYLSLISSGSGVAQWVLVDRKPATTSGINKNPSQNAAAARLVTHNAKLYAAWHETSATSAVFQIRVAVYNGLDLTPVWTFVDGNLAAKGINFAPLRAAQNVRLTSCASPANAAVPVLYAAWEEIEPTKNAQQVRVAALTGTDAAPKWVFVDGNTAFGLNYNTAMDAKSPSVACLGSSLIVAWQEASATVVGSPQRIRAKQFNGDLVTPVWKSFDRSAGLNFDVSQSATNVRLRTSASGQVFATWEETDAQSTKSQVRVASFSGPIDLPVWSFLDGARSTSSVNDDVTKSANRPVLIVSPVPEFSLFAFWHETYAPSGKTHVRGAALGIDATQWQSLQYACIRRSSSAPVTVGNLLLPELSTPGSLDFGRWIRIDTSSPTVRSVTLSGDITRVVSTALAVQTVDVFNQASLTQGSFKLMYGEFHETACINWNATAATGANSLKSALEMIPGLALSVNVVKDTDAFHDGHQYLVTFFFPSMGLQSLRVKDVPEDMSCTPFTCLPTALFACSVASLVKVNRNADVTFRPGVLDALVQFSFPVIVQPGAVIPPKLTLETGNVDTEALYTSRSALQEFDVGTDAPSPILRGGFRLSYGNFSGGGGLGVGQINTTECIDVPSDDSDGAQELHEKLRAAMPELTTIGISLITRERRKNGFRYRVSLRNSPDLLDLVSADASSCPQFAGRTQTIDVFAASQILQGEFKVQFGDAVSGCIPWNLRAKGGSAGLQQSASLQNVLSSIVPNRLVAVQVTKDPSVFVHGHRYYLEFMKLDDATEELLVIQDAVACAAFACDDGAGGATVCVGLKLAVNADFKAKRAKSETLSFRYLVQTSDDTSVLTYRDASALSGAIVRASKNPSVLATLTLPVPALPLRNALGAQVTIVSEDLIPSVLRVYAATLNGEYTVGDEIVLFIQFTGAVLVQGVPLLELNSKGVAMYFTGTGTNTLEFRYKVAEDESTTSLDYATRHSLLIPDSRSSVRYYSSTEDSPSTLLDANLLLPTLGTVSSLAPTKQIAIDTSTPTIVSVSSPNVDTAPGAKGYGVGDVLLLTVTFSKEVVVLGTPAMRLSADPTTAIATFQYGSYRQLIDVGVYATSPLVSGQFAITYGGTQSGCIDFQDADSVALTSMRSRLLEIEAIQRIGIAAVNLASVKNGKRFEIMFRSTQVLDLPLVIEPIVSDVCAPLLPSSDAPEKLISKATDTVVTFQYAIGVGHASLDLDTSGPALVLPDADTMILRRAKDPSIATDLTLPVVGNANRLGSKKNLVVDGAPIVILDIISDSDSGTYGVAFPPIASPLTVFPGEILFYLVFSRPVRVVGTPTVELATGSLQPNGLFLANRFAKFVGQPQPDQVAFLYHVLEGDFSSNLAFASANVLANAQIYGVSTSSSALANTVLPRLTVSGTSVLRIDAFSVPTTVKLSSPHKDGTFGAGEAIQIQVAFSKPVILQTGLNQNQDYYARYPTSLVFQNNIYVLWTEWEKLYVRTRSYLYLAVFSASTLERIPTAASPIVINRVPNTFIEKASMTVWNDRIYAAWDENGLIFCAKYNGLTATEAWTLIPNMGANKNMAMQASQPFLFVHNLILVIIWRELAQPVATGGGLGLVGQIRVALRNDDIDAPLWIFHDGNQLSAGLNRDPWCDAKEPSAIVFKGTMFVTWLEARSADNNKEAYEVVVARRNIVNRDQSTWLYLDALASTKSIYSFVSAYTPRLAVRRRGFEDSALIITWYRDTEFENATEVLVGQVSDSDWAAAPTVAESVPYTLNGLRNPSLVSSRQLSTQKLAVETCGDALYAVWMQDAPPKDTNQALAANIGVLSRAADSVYSGWKSVFNGTTVNQNQGFDAMDANLVCSSPIGSSSPEIGVFWTEFDGYSTKLRFRHQRVQTRSLSFPPGSYWEEVTSGKPLLKMGTGTTPPGLAVNTDVSGIESYVLNFLYIVAQGENAVAIDVLDHTALVFNGAAVRDYLGQVPDYTLFPNANDMRALSYNNKITIDTSVPRIVDVTALTASGEYGVGQQLLLQVVFTAPVAVAAAPEINSYPVLYLCSDELHFLDANVNPAKYLSGSGSNVLVFEYITTELDYAEKLDYFHSGSLVLLGNSVIQRGSLGSAIQRNATFPTTDALLALPPPKSPHSLSGNRAIAIKPTQPRVVQVTSSNADGTYHPGDTIVLQVVFSLPVLVFGSPVLLLETSVPKTFASFTSGNKTTTLSFTYSIAVGDQSAGLDVVDDRNGNLMLNYVLSLELAGRARILRLSTNPSTAAVVALPAPGTPGSLSVTKNLVVDSVQPTIIDVRSATVDGTYDIGDQIEVLVEFSRQVVVRGVPQVILNVAGSFDRTAVYTGGSGSAILRFVYSPVAGDSTQNTPLDIRDEDAFILKPLLMGRELTVEPAQVLCVAQVPSLSADLTMPRPGVPLQINSVRSLVGNGLKLFVRTDGFRVQDVQTNLVSGEVYAPGQILRLSVLFTGPVVVAGSPRLALNVNALVQKYAAYTKGSGTNELQFKYVVVNGDSVKVLDVASPVALELNGGMVTDASGGVYVPLRLGGPYLPGSLSFKYQIEVSSTPPIVERVYAVSPNGTFGVGDDVQVAVRFSRRVTFLLVTPVAPAAPTLLLQLQAGIKTAVYVSGDATRDLVFKFRVLTGDSALKLEYATQNALVGTLFAMATTPTVQVVTQLPVPGTSAQSLSKQSQIHIDSNPPKVLRVVAVDRNGTYGLGDRVRFRVHFSYRVVVPIISQASCGLELSLGNRVVRLATYSGGSTTKILEFGYTVAAGDRSGRLDYTAQDSLVCLVFQFSALLSLTAAMSLPNPGSEGSLSHSSDLRVDSTAPRVILVSSPLVNDVYGAGQVIDVTVSFSEAVTFIQGQPRLRLAIGSSKPRLSGVAFASYVSGKDSATLTFRYTSQEGDMALPLAYDGVDALSLADSAANLERIFAAANGDPSFRVATLRLPIPMATGSLSNLRDIQIDTFEPPRVVSVSSATPDGIYTAGDVLQVTVTFSAPVVVSGTPKLRLDTGNTPGVALYTSGSGTASLIFQYAVQPGDHTDRLDYQRCPDTERRPPQRREWYKLVICAQPANALQLGGPGSTIKRLATTPSSNAVLDLPEVSSWPKLRFHTSRDDFVYVDQLEATTDILEAERTLRPPLVNEFTISQQRASIRMYSNGIPDHANNLMGSDTNEDLQAKLVIKEQRYFVELKRFPEQQGLPLWTDSYNGFVGMFLNGIPFKNASSVAVPPSTPTSFDACGGALDDSGRYFYRDLPTCYLAKLGELPLPSQQQEPRLASPIVGYAFDGFPIYGFYDENGELPRHLDECNGRLRFDGKYCYHLIPPSRTSSKERSTLPLCLKGIDASQVDSLLRVFKFPVDIRAVEGLSLANLSRFDGLVIDENPTTLLTDKLWLNPADVSVVYTSKSVVVRSTGVPDGSFGPFPNAYNKHSVKSQNYVFAFPRQPVAQTTTTALPMDTPIGIMLNGVPFFSAKSDSYGADVMSSASPALLLMDKCNGLVDSGGDYRYYASPDCLLSDLKANEVNKPSPLIGYAFDGFPLYGPYNEDGALPKDLDECNGRIGYDGTYRYHVTFTFPYLIGCFRGLPTSVVGGVIASWSTNLYRSLSYGHDLRINTEAPRVSQVFTSKASSTYVAGETLDIVVQWSMPVSVDTVMGRPSIPVANSTGFALFDASRSSSQASVFIYRVDTDVGPFSFDYRTNILLNGAKIRRLAATPTLDADLRLVNAESIPRFASKHQLVQNVKVTMRGLYHPKASDLSVRLFHETRSAVVIANCCNERTDAFGEPDRTLRVNKEQIEVYPANPTSGVGFDYSFQDLTGAKNLAVDGGATALQSSTSGLCSASNAIDGRIEGFASSQTVARTDSKANQTAWWELQLLKETDIGTVRLWMAQEERLPAVVQQLKVNSNDAVSPVTGTFTLIFTASDGSQHSTAPISYNAVAMIADEDQKIENLGIGKAESVQAKLIALQGMPRIFITRFPADTAQSPNGAFSWSITFLENPKLYKQSPTSPPPLRLGINLICSGAGVIELLSPLPGDDVDPWNYVERDDRPEGLSIGKLSMFPFWILLFGDAAVMDFESFQEAYEAALWVHRVDESVAQRRVVSVNPPFNTKARYIRVVATKPYARLTLAEVQVYKERAHLLSQYEGGTPVTTEFYPGAEIWSPEDPFQAAFGGMTSEGTWTLAIQDTVVKQQIGDSTIHGDGAISDWVLAVTNMAGLTRTYYMDIKAHVKTLPRHGKLYIGVQETEADHLDSDRNGILDSSEANAYLSRYLLSYDVFPALTKKRALLGFLEGYEKFGGIEILEDASERQKLLPIACDTRCLADIHMDPFFYANGPGDMGLKLMEIVGDRVIKYVPNAEFRGRDTITFSISIGTTESAVLGTVELYVRECEDVDCKMDMQILHRSV